MGLQRDNWNVSASWRFLDEMDIEDQIGVGVLDSKTDSVNYFDLYGVYSWDRLEVSLGIENLTDESPPFIPSISTNTSPTFDYLGRIYSARLKFTL